jgi:hypothetical protein
MFAARETVAAAVALTVLKNPFFIGDVNGATTGDDVILALALENAFIKEKPDFTSFGGAVFPAGGAAADDRR